MTGEVATLSEVEVPNGLWYVDSGNRFFFKFINVNARTEIIMAKIAKPTITKSNLVFVDKPEAYIDLATDASVAMTGGGGGTKAVSGMV